MRRKRDVCDGRRGPPNWKTGTGRAFVWLGLSLQGMTSKIEAFFAKKSSSGLSTHNKIALNVTCVT